MGRRGRGNENGCGELDIFKGVVEMGDAMETGCRWSKGTRGAGTRGLSSSVYEPIARRSASASMGTWWRTMARKQQAGGESETVAYRILKTFDTYTQQTSPKSKLD
ncbi:hypothetical protein EDB89DRAFT_2244898 [Lactarius sanguifluus]|nr:hypothetical protein EDB89DRAFT_2244898 [Lactarius sanguifluus]